MSVTDGLRLALHCVEFLSQQFYSSVSRAAGWRLGVTQLRLNLIHFIRVSVVALSRTTRIHTCNQIFSLAAPNSFDPSLEKVLALKKKKTK